MSTVSLSDYTSLRYQVANAGYADEIEWANNIPECPDCYAFRDEYCWTVINSGMKEQVARLIWNRIKAARADGFSTATAFRHKQKVSAIDAMFEHCAERFNEWKQSTDRLTYLRGLPFIGPITIWHFAKNLGMDVAKPDRHLVRIAGSIEAVMPLCRELHELSGDKIAGVDTVLWRAANLGFI
jgi:hypothetical protein